MSREVEFHFRIVKGHCKRLIIRKGIGVGLRLTNLEVPEGSSRFSIALNDLLYQWVQRITKLLLCLFLFSLSLLSLSLPYPEFSLPPTAAQWDSSFGNSIINGRVGINGHVLLLFCLRPFTIRSSFHTFLVYISPACAMAPVQGQTAGVQLKVQS